MARSCYHPWLEGPRGGRVYQNHERTTAASRSHTFTRGTWSTRQRGSQRNTETCSFLLPSTPCCCSTWPNPTCRWKTRCPSCQLPLQVRAAGRRLEPGRGGPSPSPGSSSGESSPECGSFLLAPGAHSPWRNYKASWYFQCILSPR